MNGDTTRPSLQASLEADLVRQHLEFLDSYRRLYDRSSVETLLALSEDAAAFRLCQGINQALNALFSAFGRAEDGGRPDAFLTLRQCVGLPKDHPSTQLLHRQLHILRKTAESLHGLVTGRGLDRSEMPTAPPVMPEMPTFSDVRSIGVAAASPLPSDLPAPTEERSPSPDARPREDDVGVRYCIVDEARRSSRPARQKKSG